MNMDIELYWQLIVFQRVCTSWGLGVILWVKILKLLLGVSTVTLVRKCLSSWFDMFIEKMTFNGSNMQLVQHASSHQGEQHAIGSEKKCLTQGMIPNPENRLCFDNLDFSRIPNPNHKNKTFPSRSRTTNPIPALP